MANEALFRVVGKRRRKLLIGMDAIDHERVISGSEEGALGGVIAGAEDMRGIRDVLAIGTGSSVVSAAVSALMREPAGVKLGAYGVGVTVTGALAVRRVVKAYSRLLTAHLRQNGWGSILTKAAHEHFLAQGLHNEFAHGKVQLDVVGDRLNIPLRIQASFPKPAGRARALLRRAK